MFESSEVAEKRQILKLLLQNPTVKEKKLGFSYWAPLTGRCSNLFGGVDIIKYLDILLDMLRLVLPSKKYMKEFTAYIRELYKRKEISKKEFNDKIKRNKDINAFLKRLKDDRNGINLEKNKIAYTIYWLVNGKKYIGTLRLNKRLNKKLRIRGGHIGYVIRPSERKKGYGAKILRLGLLKAKTKGLKKVLIDCRENNIASKKIIEANGGVFIKKKRVKGEPASLHYYINVK